MPIPRADLALRREVLVLFDMCGIDSGHVIFIDEIDLPALQVSNFDQGVGTPGIVLSLFGPGALLVKMPQRGAECRCFIDTSLRYRVGMDQSEIKSCCVGSIQHRGMSCNHAHNRVASVRHAITPEST